MLLLWQYHAVATSVGGRVRRRRRCHHRRRRRCSCFCICCSRYRSLYVVVGLIEKIGAQANCKTLVCFEKFCFSPLAPTKRGWQR